MPRRIRVCHVVSRLNVGGMENGVVNVCNGLNRARFEPVILCLHGAGPMIDRVRADVRVVNLNLPDRLSLTAFVRTMRFFRELSADIVHTHGWGGGSLYAIPGARLAGVPVVINGEHGELFLKGAQVIAQRLLAPFCDGILAVSETLKGRVAANVGIHPSRIRVIRNGVDSRHFDGERFSPKLRHELNARYGIDTDEDFVVGCIGSLKPVKNQKLLVRALERIGRERPRHRIRVLFAGNGPDRPRLERYIRESNMRAQVAFLGERSDIAELLSVIDVLVSTSAASHEGLSNVVLEAMASRCPVIATRSVGMAEIVCDGDNGFLIEPDDVIDLTRKIKALADDRELLDRMGEKARRFVTTSFNLESMIAEYENIYREFVAARTALRDLRLSRETV